MNEKLTLEERRRLAQAAILTRVRAHDQGAKRGDVYDFLLTTMAEDVENRRSTLGEHVVAANTECERRLKSSGVVHLHVVTDLVTDDGEVLVPKLAFDFGIPGVLIKDYDRLPGLLAQMIALAFSGWFTNPREKELWMSDLKHTMEIDDKGLQILYACDQCGKTYRTVRSLTDHLRHKEHVDSILDQYGYWGGEYASMAAGVARPAARPAPPVVDVDVLREVDPHRPTEPATPAPFAEPATDAGPWTGVIRTSTELS